jgi:hypothetical protein
MLKLTHGFGFVHCAFSRKAPRNVNAHAWIVAYISES